MTNVHYELSQPSKVTAKCVTKDFVNLFIFDKCMKF